MKHPASALLALLLISPTLRGELPPSAYRQMEAAAPEALRLRILSVERDFTQGRTPRAEMVRARAEVLEVTRSATGREPGDEVALQYVHDPLPEGMVGPGPVPVVRSTAEYQAFLEGAGPGTYSPAAKGASFRQVSPPTPGAAPDPPPERVQDFLGSPAYAGGLAVFLLLVLGGTAALLRRRRAEASKEEEADPEEDMATQFRVAPVLRDPED